MEITIYLDKIWEDHETITDPKEVAKRIRSNLSHLGAMTIYYEPKKTWFRKILDAFS